MKDVITYTGVPSVTDSSFGRFKLYCSISDNETAELFYQKVGADLLLFQSADGENWLHAIMDSFIRGLSLEHDLRLCLTVKHYKPSLGLEFCDNKEF